MRSLATTSSTSDDQIVLAMLSSVENNSMITQRSLAQELDIALGLANSYLKRCVKKGLIKISAVPPRRYAYYLTPHGFAEKSALTAKYLRSSFGFFRIARVQCSELIQYCATSNRTRIVLAGSGELAEIALLSSREWPAVSVEAVIDPARAGQNLLGHPIVADFPADRFHAALVVDVDRPQALYRDLCDRLGSDRVLAPPLLRLSNKAPAEVVAP